MRPRELASEYVNEHARLVADVLTTDVLTVAEDASPGKIAELMGKHRIKRISVLNNGRITGLVSCADPIRALVSVEPDLRGVSRQATEKCAKPFAPH
ncbi:CBS domain-containing protein [Paraburkholderia tagetis]|uniref:CBS domain-containing protein n=1 Tax=Paraburkholderia tagetis TaxID=2913261 RepID=A0A9X1UL09_9BURK|nr:CBS domain-containing protein [Paraburkholderia tagetis]MCG5076916.1 CBS domain-containing protein [Paraburkholderia tagetis]